jgi:Holliday junction resolvasome RuvABC endonuclease subunit
VSERIVGIDFSLTCTGVGEIVRQPGAAPVASAATFGSSGNRADTLPDRHERLTDLANRVVEHCAGARLAVVELPTTGARGASPIDRHHAWWLIVGGLVRREVPVATVASTSLKLAIAGSGRADKAALAIAVERLWPGLDVSSSDVSDAVGMAHLGAVRLGWDVPTLERHHQVKAVWPELPDPCADGSALVS